MKEDFLRIFAQYCQYNDAYLIIDKIFKIFDKVHNIYYYNPSNMNVG